MSKQARHLAVSEENRPYNAQLCSAPVQSENVAWKDQGLHMQERQSGLDTEAKGDNMISAIHHQVSPPCSLLARPPFLSSSIRLLKHLCERKAISALPHALVASTDSLQHIQGEG